MFDWLTKNALEWLKTPAHYFLPLLAASAFGLFVPLDILKFLGIEVWRVEGKPYLGSIFVVSLAVVAIHYSSEVVRWIAKKYRGSRSLRAAHVRLESLTPDEQQLLSGYLKENTKTQLLFPNSGVVTGLTGADIIYPSASQSYGHTFPFNIRPWAWAYLKKNPHLVGVKSIGDHVNKP